MKADLTVSVLLSVYHYLNCTDMQKEAFRGKGNCPIHKPPILCYFMFLMSNSTFCSPDLKYK